MSAENPQLHTQLPLEIDGKAMLDTAPEAELAYAYPLYVGVLGTVQTAIPTVDHETGHLDPDIEDLQAPTTKFGITQLHMHGRRHDERLYADKQEERFPTNMWFIGTRNEILHNVITEALVYMETEGIHDAVDLPEEMKMEIIRRYVDFEIACKTAVNELGINPTELRRRTLAYRARKYNVDEMNQIRADIMANDAETGVIQTDDEIDSEVKKRVKLKNAKTDRMDKTLRFSHIDVSTYAAQQALTAQWESDFTNGRELDFENGAAQMISELEESQEKVLEFFEKYKLGRIPARQLSWKERYDMASEIDDVGVAGLSLLNKLDIDIEPIIQERLALREQRYAREIVHAYYEFYGDMRLALEAARRSESWKTSDGEAIYQMNFFVHPATVGSFPDADEAHARRSKYDPDGSAAVRTSDFVAHSTVNGSAQVNLTPPKSMPLLSRSAGYTNGRDELVEGQSKNSRNKRPSHPQSKHPARVTVWRRRM